MAAAVIANNVLRDSPFPELAQVFKQLLSRTSNESVTDHILAGLATDALPLRVANVWVSGFADAPSLVKALRYEESVGVRRQAIKRIIRLLRDEAQMAALWDAIGGTAGWLKLFSELSVHDVQSLCHAFGRTSTFDAGREMRQRLMTELTMCLLSEQFPQAKHANPERRSFVKFYTNIVPACTVQFVKAWEANGNLPRAGGRWLDHAHYRYTRGRCLQHLRASKSAPFRFEYFRNVFHELPPEESTKHMSQSMQFSMHVLEYLAEHGELGVSAAQINASIAIPMLRRLARRKAPHHVRGKVLKAIARALAPRVKNGDNLDFSTYGPVRTALYCWNRDSVAHENTLLDILHLAPATQHTISLATFGDMLCWVRDSLRYKLLGLMLAHIRLVSADLENDSQMGALGPWPSNIFTSLPSEKAQDLLQRLIRLRHKELWAGVIFTALQPAHAVSLLDELSRIRPAGNYIYWESMESRHPMFGFSHNQDVAILRLFVSPPSDERLRGWKTVVEERKKEAARARDQSDRAQWARSAIFCSIASGSLQAYEDVLIWARRYNRDPLTVKTLYARGTIKRTVGVRLLSGIPSDLEKSTLDAGSVHEDVAKGNRIMLVLLETAFQGIREPSFQAYDWAAVRELFSEVVKLRIAEADRLQDLLSLSDDQMYEMLWKDTLNTILRAEEQCLLDEHTKLGAQRVNGLLGQTTIPMIQTFTPSKCRFVDELAKGRNELWQKYRRSKDPNVVSLPSPWPQGLGFRDAMSVNVGLDKPGYAGRLPYLEARAEGIVFAKPSDVMTAFPEDNDVRKAIGGHVDDYREALEFYVGAGVDKEGRDQRKRLAWTHAVGPLSEGRGLSADEAVLFWEEIFKKSWAEIPMTRSISVPMPPDPTVPNPDDPNEPTEWNPDPNPDQWKVSPSRELSVTCLDAMLQSNKSDWNSDSVRVLRKPSPTTAAHPSFAAIWEAPYSRSMGTIAPAVREGLVAIGLMLINSKCCPSKRLFARPFPSPEDARFPALFLDEDFLDRDGITPDTGFAILEALGKELPLTPVAELCEAMLSNLGQGENPRRDFEQETLRLLKLLVEGDRPNLALDLVRKVVIDRPDASSWHRHMLTTGLFDRLKSDRARRFIWEIALSMKTKLQEQAQRKVGAEWDPPASPGPVIKVTTVTALAQLLSGARFLTNEEIIDILTSIFANASHPDIRVAIIQSLTSTLQKTRRDTVKAKIIDALEAYAVPVAGSLSERSPLSEDDWQKAESTSEVPEVNDPQSKAPQPVLAAIISAYETLSGDIVSELYHRILLPIFDASAANNRRWTRIFLRNRGLRCDVDSLPLVPPKPQLFAAVTKKATAHRREELFTLWSEAIMTNLDPPSDVAEINTIILNNEALGSSNSGKHWLALWHNPGLAALSYAGPQLHTYLPRPDDNTSLPIPLIQRIVYDQLDLMILRDDERFSEQNHILNHLARPQHKNAAWETTWQENVRPLIRDVLDRIEGLRTEAWQRDPHRHPVALRSTLEMRLWLLTWPGYDDRLREKPDHDGRLETFAAELRDELADLARLCVERARPYHKPFAEVKEAARAVHPQDISLLALRLGTACSQGTAVNLADRLGMEVAEVLLTTGATKPRDRDAEVVAKVGEMIRGWRGSSDEGVRMTALRTGRVMEGRRTGHLKWFWEMGGLL